MPFSQQGFAMHGCKIGGVEIAALATRSMVR